MEEADYWWTIGLIADTIEWYGWNQVMYDLNSLRPDLFESSSGEEDETTEV